MYDYIIVGQGLAGSLFAYKCIQNHKTFVVIDPGDQNNASQTSSGMYNPVILKRFTPVWNALEQIDQVKEIMADIEGYLQIPLLEEVKINRIFHSEDERKTWVQKTKKKDLAPFLNLETEHISNPYIENQFDTGEVLQGGKINVKAFLNKFRESLQKNKQLVEEKVDYNQLNVLDTMIEYKTLQAERVVFCEGYELKENPFFNDLPLIGNKGETMVIKAPDLKLDRVVKSKVFIMPLEHDEYFIGATYNWNDKDSNPTEEGKKELVEKLKTFLKCDFEIIAHKAGIRPTVIDRRPLVGQHSEYHNVYVLNGLGTRGVMLGCSMANSLYNFIEKGESLINEISINRFKTLKK